MVGSPVIIANEDDDGQTGSAAPSKAEARNPAQPKVVPLERTLKAPQPEPSPAKQKVATPSKATPYIVESKEALQRKGELEPKLKQLKTKHW